MKILIFGASGMLGHKLVQRLSGGFDVTGTIRGSFSAVERFGIFDPARTIENVTVQDRRSIEATFESVRPEVVINACGIVKQVRDAADAIANLEVNSLFPHILKAFSEKYATRLISISTDCVFDGVRGFYSESDTPNATDLYGMSKRLGEVEGPNCLTIRSSIVGRELTSAHGLLEWALSNRGKRINGYINAIYSGFPTTEFADIITSLITDHKELSGLYHIASDPINKFELLKLINKYYDAGIEIVPSGDFKIDRSLNGARFSSQTGFRPKPWEQLIAEMAADTTPYDDWKK